MADENNDKWDRLPKVSFDKKDLKRRMRKVQGATVRHAHKFIIKRWGSVRESQKHISIWVLAMGLLIAATGLQLMWYQQSYRTDAPANDGTYAEATLGPVDTLNPLFAASSAEQSASYLMFSRLLNYDKTGHLGYDIVTGIITNDLKTVYTVTIRPDVKWHDGYDLTTKDVAYTISLIKNSALRTSISGWSNINVKVIDDANIEFSLQSSYAAFEHFLTFPILPEHILGSIPPANLRENDFSQNPIGSGPFKFRFIHDINLKTGSKIIYLARNDDYYNGKAKLEFFQLHAYESKDAILKALKINEVNAAADLSISDIPNVDSKRYEIINKPIQSGVYAIINTTSAILKGSVVRRALQVATNTNDIRSKMPNGIPALDFPFTEGQLSGEVPKAPLFDLATANRLLDEDGWALNPQGFRTKDGIELRISIVTLKDSELESTINLLADQWRLLGIKIETKVVDLTDTLQNVVQSVLQPRNYDVLLYRLNIGADPDVYPYWHSSQASIQGSNFANYSNTISDDALLSARTRVEPALRNAKYITFAKQWLQDVPAIGLYQSTAQYVFNDSVRLADGSSVLVTAVDRYCDVLDWTVGTRSVYKTP